MFAGRRKNSEAGPISKLLSERRVIEALGSIEGGRPDWHQVDKSGHPLRVRKVGGLCRRGCIRGVEERETWKETDDDRKRKRAGCIYSAACRGYGRHDIGNAAADNV